MPPSTNAAIRRTGIGTAVLACALAVSLAAVVALPSGPAQAQTALARAQADAKALAALGIAEKGSGPVLVLREGRRLPAGTVITQGGLANVAKARRAGRPVGGAARRAGVVRVRSPRVMRTGPEPAWMYYEDRAPFQSFQHPGRVVIVGARSGRARVSRTLLWPPLVGGRLPRYLTSQARYASKRFRVYYRPWSSTGADLPGTPGRGGVSGPARIAATPLAARLDAAAALGAERTCAITVANTVGRFYDAVGVDRARRSWDALFRSWARMDDRIVARRYTTSSGRTPAGFARGVISSRNCKQALLFVSGGGYRRGRPAVNLGTRGRADATLTQQLLGAKQLRKLLDALPGTRFHVVIDAPSGGAFLPALAGARNLAQFAAASRAGEGAFGALPSYDAGGETIETNPEGLPLLSNRLLAGMGSFLSDAQQRDAALAAHSQGRSFLAWMLDRAFALARSEDPSTVLPGAPQPVLRTFVSLAPAEVPDEEPPDPPVPPAPVANPQAVTTTEEESIEITLSGHNAEGAAFDIASPPAHGTLTGSGAQRTYQPDPDFHGTDSFDFRITDSRGRASTATVTVRVLAITHPPVVSTSGGTVTFVEPAGPIPQDLEGVVIDDGVTITTRRPTTLVGATVSIVGGFNGSEDVLQFADQPEITGAYERATGTLNLRGEATPAEYEDALRSVRYANTSKNPGTTPREIAFAAAAGVLVDPGSPLSQAVWSDAAVRSVEVEAFDDPPTLSHPATKVVYDSGQVPDGVVVAPAMVVADPDSTTVDGVAVRIVGGFEAAQDRLALTLPPDSPISWAYDEATGTATLSGVATLEQYQDALRDVSYSNLSANPSLQPRTIEFALSDPCGSRPGACVTRTVKLSAVNDPPEVRLSDALPVYVEKEPGVAIDPGLGVSDADDSELVGATAAITGGLSVGEDRLEYTDQNGIVGAYNSTNGVLTLTGTAAVEDYEAALRSIRYRNTSNQPSAAPRVVTLRAHDSTSGSAPVAKSVSVVPLHDDFPVVTMDGDPLHYVEKGTSLLDPTIRVRAGDSSTIERVTLRIETGFAEAEDVLEFSDQNGITGSYEGGVLTLSGTAPVETYQAALRTVSYRNSSSNPSIADRVVSVVAFDGVGDGEPAQRRITVTPVNDPPVALPSDGDAEYVENPDLTPIAIDDGIGVADPDDTELTRAQVSFDPASFVAAEDRLAYSTTAGIQGAIDDAAGVLTLTPVSGPSASLSAFETALRAVGYFNASSDNVTGGHRTVRFQLTDAGSPPLAGPVATRGLNVVPVNDPPTIAGELTTSAVANTRLIYGGPADPTVAARRVPSVSVLMNASDPDGPISVKTSGEGASPTTSELGGVVEWQGNGTFVYDPPVDHRGETDRLSYVVTDGEFDVQGAINVRIGSDRVWYVRNDAAAGGDGTSHAPFETLAEVQAAATRSGPTNPDTIFIYPSTDLSGLDTGLTLLANQRLVGAGADLTVEGRHLWTGSAASTPRITNTAGAALTMGSDTGYDGLSVDPSPDRVGVLVPGASTGVAIRGGVDDAAPTSNQPGVFVVGSASIENAVIKTDGGTALSVAAGGRAAFSGNDTLLDATGAKALDTTTGSTLSGLLTSIKVTDSPDGGVNLRGLAPAPGGTASNPTELTLRNLDIATTGGTAFNLESIPPAAKVTVREAGEGSIEATNGPAIIVNGVLSYGELSFNDVSSTDSPTFGVRVSGYVGASIEVDPDRTSFSTTGGTISGAEVGFQVDSDVSGNPTTTTYGGSIVAAPDKKAVRVLSRLSTAVTNVGGGISGGGLDFTGSSANTLNIDGPTEIDTTANGVVASNSSTGSRVNLNNVTSIKSTNGVAINRAAANVLNIAGSGIDLETANGVGIQSTASSSGSLGLANASFNSIRVTGTGAGISAGVTATVNMTGDRTISAGGGRGLDWTGGTLTLTSSGSPIDLEVGSGIGIRSSSTLTTSSASFSEFEVGAGGTGIQTGGGSTLAFPNGAELSTSSGTLLLATGGTSTVTGNNLTFDVNSGFALRSTGGTSLTATGSGAKVNVGPGGSGLHATGGAASISGSGATINVAGGGTGLRAAGGTASLTGAGATVNVEAGGTGLLGTSGTLTASGAGFTLNAPEGTTHMALSGASLNLTGGAPALNIPSDVTPVSAAAGTITLGGNNVSFSTEGVPAISVAGSAALIVTGGGNTLTSTDAPALAITGSAQLGGSGATFRSISATGGDSGIDFRTTNTSSTGTLNVTGDGSNARNGSGGTIQDTSGPCVRFQNARQPALTSMRILDCGGEAIVGTGIRAGFTFRGLEVGMTDDDQYLGTGAAIDIANTAAGTGTITDSEIADGYDDNVKIRHSSGALTLNINNNEIHDNGPDGGSGRGLYLINNSTTASTWNIGSATGNTFTDNKAEQIYVSQASTGAITTTIARNSLTSTRDDLTASGGGILIASDSSNAGRVNYNVGTTTAGTGNSIVGAQGSAIAARRRAAVTSTSGRFVGRIQGNTIGGSGSGSGSSSGSGIEIETKGARSTNTQVVNIVGNQIRDWSVNGMLLDGSSGAATMSVNATANTIGQGSAGTHGVSVLSGHTAAKPVCLNLGGSGGLANDMAGSAFDGFDLRLQASGSGTFTAPSYSAPASNYFGNRNPGITVSATGTITSANCASS